MQREEGPISGAEQADVEARGCYSRVEEGQINLNFGVSGGGIASYRRSALNS